MTGVQTCALPICLPGPQGLPGQAATIAIGAVSSVPWGTAPTVTNSGTSSAAIFNFQLQTGPQGAQGVKGDTGSQGPAGQGVPTGGSAGQVLSKIDGTNYNTQWTTLPSAPVTSVAGKTGAVTLTVGDVSGAAPTNSPTFTGTVTIPSGASIAGYATQSYVTSQGYITSSALTPYLLSSTAASTYQTLSGMSAYLTTSAASSTYQTKAPNDGNYYIQQSGSWTQLVVY